ncbi:hypothetical protein CRM22_010190 [Opisthorchis felineus]|uniref:Transmembrane protein 65 n=1 Tax=Opisthorchis felineus TaxID=147828 RepID=A0A4S2L6L8_OPIFE|nr:hypothetical protein CRM22_010190 [Opisthorchis felineus]
MPPHCRQLLFSYLTRGSIRSFGTSASNWGGFGRNVGGWARRIVNGLSETERTILLQELSKHKASSKITAPTGQETISHLNTTHLRLIFLANGLPFIGFGFLDNAIMIIAGEYIDFTFSSVFGLSTMAAAGLGNWVSDLCGIGTVGYVERFATRLGFVTPPMRPELAGSRLFMWTTMLGRITGITIGCLLGLLPLLFFERDKNTESRAPQTKP